MGKGKGAVEWAAVVKPEELCLKLEVPLSVAKRRYVLRLKSFQLKLSS
jgi:ribosomal protein L16/L10AE